MKITTEAIIDALLCKKKMKKKEEKGKISIFRHYYDRPNQAAIYIAEDNMVTIDVDKDKIDITRYKDDYAYEYVKPDSIDGAVEHLTYFITNGELRDGEAI